MRFDGRSRNFTFDTFTGRFKDALNELADQNMTEETKVMTFRNAFQMQEFRHLHSTISSTQRLRTNLDNTIAFVGEQIRTMKQQNGVNQSRHLASYAKSPAKTAHKKWVNPKSKKSSNKKKKPNTKFDPKVPGAYLTKSAWFKLTEEQKKASRDARNEQGRTSTISSNCNHIHSVFGGED